MNEKIKKLLVELLMHENVVGSWGITEIKIEENEVSFLVSAFMYNGIVRIRCNDENYSVQLDEKTIVGFELYSIVDVIDKEIEASTDYYKKVARWIAEKK